MPDYSLLRVFGCSCYPNLTAYRHDKLSPKSARCVFLGYSPLYRGYKCHDPLTKKTFVSRNVIFDETSFPFSETLSPVSEVASSNSEVDEMVFIPIGVSSVPLLVPSPVTLPSTSDPILPTSDFISPTEPTSDSILPSTTIITRSKPGISKCKPLPSDFVAHHAFLYSLPLALTSVLHSEVEPKNYKVASKEAKCVRSMRSENTSLRENDTWNLVMLMV